MPTEAELTLYYATAYRRDYQMTSKPPKAHLTRSRREALSRLKFLGPKLEKPCTILDLGCGAGEFLAFAARDGHRTVGLEPGPEFAAYARDVNGIEVSQCCWYDAKFESGHFDVITLHHVLEHLREPVNALKKLHEWLADDGILYIAVPNLSSPRDQPFEHFHFAHVYNFSPPTLVKAAMVAGFELDPNVPPRGTNMVFRKRTAGPLPRSDVPKQSEGSFERFPPVRPIMYLLSGKWLLRASGRFKKSVRDSRSKSLPVQQETNMSQP